MKSIFLSFSLIFFFACSAINVDMPAVKITKSIPVDSRLDAYQITNQWIDDNIPFAEQVHNDSLLIYLEAPDVIIRFTEAEVILKLTTSESLHHHILDTFEEHLLNQLSVSQL